MSMRGKNIIIPIIFFLFLCLFTSCFRSFEVNGFKSKEVNYDWGIVGAKLLGSERKSLNTIYKESPYQLLVWFGSELGIVGKIQISEISLSYADTKEVIFTKISVPEKEMALYESEFLAFFSFEEIDLNYSDLVLSIQFFIELNGNKKKESADIFFKTDFQKFRRIEGV